MTTATHYEVLGVTRTAEPSVIRAAYKALVLSFHPDKTLHLSPEERAERSHRFRDVQEAWDVLGNPALKVAYDRELERHGNRVNPSYSTFHRQTSTSRRRPSVRVTSPEEKRACAAKIKEDLLYLSEQRRKRDAEDDSMDVAGLKYMLEIWCAMAQEYEDDVLGDGFMRAHCAVQIQVYQAKIAQRKRQHEEYFEGMSRPRSPAAKPARPAASRPAANTPRPRTATPAPKPMPRAAATNSSFTGSCSAASVRADEKARKDAVKQAQVDAKAAAVRAEKEKQKAKAEEKARLESERIAHVRAKVGAPPLGKWGAGGAAEVKSPSPSSFRVNPQESRSATKPVEKNPCPTCGGTEHTTFSEFRKCKLQSRSRVIEEEEESFFRTV